MDKDYVMRIAGTIREQLVSMTDTAILMSWGIQEFMATIYKDLPGLKFRVNGRLFQGYVLICLNGSDYYEVYLLMRKKPDALVMKFALMNWERLSTDT